MYDEPKIPFNFIKNDDCLVYLHTTSLENAKQIVKEGFKFSDIIEKTTDCVNCRPDEFNFTVGYLISQRKSYGDCVIVIHIGKNLMKKYGYTMYFFEETTDYDNDVFEGPTVNKLDDQFIKGYFIKSTGECFNNPEYNSTQDKPKFRDMYYQIHPNRLD
jgi:hypothetical protein